MPYYQNRTRFALPRFRATAGWIITINVIMFFLAISVGRLTTPGKAVFDLLTLTPRSLFHGCVWQPLTYGFVDTGIFSVLFSSIMLYLYSARFENRKFLEIYFFSLIGGGLIAAAYSYTHFQAASPDADISSAWPGILGLVAVWGTWYGEQESYIFPLMFPIKAKYIALIWIGIELAMFLMTGALIFAANLGGALVGYAYVKALPGRGLGYAASEKYFGLRNSIRNLNYRWKRRRATRKFEVYMRKQDRSVYFDQYGNYINPEEQRNKGKDDAGPGGWVN